MLLTPLANFFFLLPLRINDGNMTEVNYIEQRDGGYWVQGTRVSLDSLVYRFLEGLAPDTIQSECFPTLSLEQVYGAITYYLGHRVDIDAYLQESEKGYAAFRERVRQEYPRARRIDSILQLAKPRSTETSFTN
jgi:uncharacterized protein (DUF433 family)